MQLNLLSHRQVQYGHPFPGAHLTGLVGLFTGVFMHVLLDVIEVPRPLLAPDINNNVRIGVTGICSRSLKIKKTPTTIS